MALWFHTRGPHLPALLQPRQERAVMGCRRLRTCRVALVARVADMPSHSQRSALPIWELCLSGSRSVGRDYGGQVLPVWNVTLNVGTVVASREVLGFLVFFR